MLRESTVPPFVVFCFPVQSLLQDCSFLPILTPDRWQCHKAGLCLYVEDSSFYIVEVASLCLVYWETVRLK